MLLMYGAYWLYGGPVWLAGSPFSGSSDWTVSVVWVPKGGVGSPKVNISVSSDGISYIKLPHIISVSA